MKKRYILLAGTGLIVVIIVAGLLYMARFASAVNQTQTHTASGAVTATGTPIPSTELSTFQIVPAQTTASYSVYENLISKISRIMMQLARRTRYRAVSVYEPARPRSSQQ